MPLEQRSGHARIVAPQGVTGPRGARADLTIPVHHPPVVLARDCTGDARIAAPADYERHRSSMRAATTSWSNSLADLSDTGSEVGRT